MTIPVDQAASKRRTLYIVVAIAFVVLAVVALLTFSSKRATEEAEQKADQLIAELSAAGLRTPSKDMIVQTLGDDGYAICADPTHALKRGILYGMLSNGAGGPGTRPVIADNNVVKGQLLVIKVYCPHYLEEFTELADDLKLDDVAKE